MMQNTEEDRNNWSLQSSWGEYSCSSNHSGFHSLYDSMNDRSDGSFRTSGSSENWENDDDMLETSPALLSDSSMSLETSLAGEHASDSDSDSHSTVDAHVRSPTRDLQPLHTAGHKNSAHKPPKSKANTLKGQYRAIVRGYRLSALARLTKLKAEQLIVNRKGSYVSKKRQASGKKILEDKGSYVYTKNKAYAAGLASFEWTNKKGVTSTYASLGKYQNGTLIPIYKKKLM